MKRQITLVLVGIALLFGIRGQCQSIVPFVFNASGGTYDNSSSYNRFEWSFGELMLTDTYTNAGANLILTNGVLQPYTDNVFEGAEILLFGVNDWKIFPNLTTGAFELDFFINIPGLMDLQLTDMQGKIINKRSFNYNCCNRIQRYDISNLANGTYFINARFWPERTLNLPRNQATLRQGTFKVVKIK